MSLRPLPIALLGAAALLVAGPTALSEADHAPPEPVLASATPGGGVFPVAAHRPRPRASRPERHLIVVVLPGGSVALHAGPGGRVLTHIGDRTQFGSRQALAVVQTRGRWLGVATSARQNRIAWIDRASDGIRVRETTMSLEADLSRRLVTARRGGRVVRRFHVAVGRPGSETPTGRFGVTDKLPGNRYGPYYGCCVLALSGYQPHPPAGWRGGNRLGLHGTNSPGTIGEAASAGCLRAADEDLAALMKSVPVGTTLVIHP
jgi:L,D-transpeptidase-like protein